MTYCFPKTSAPRLLLANPRGFCAGVDRAIGIVEQALERFGAPVYVRHEVVHNRFVVNRLRQMGAIFIEELHEVPPDSILIFSAHGVSKVVQDEAKSRGFQVFDATCPLVSKVHMEVVRHSRAGREVILIGHAGHPEVEGTMGRYDAAAGGAIYLIETADQVAELAIKNPTELAFVTQTTLSIEDTSSIIQALKQRFPQITGAKKSDICYATQNRQDAVRELACCCEIIFVVGSPNSSNSNRLRELAENEGARAWLIDGASEITPSMFQGLSIATIGITAGASAPEVLVEEVIAHLQACGAGSVERLQGEEETLVFVLPKELRGSRAATEQAGESL